MVIVFGLVVVLFLGGVPGLVRAVEARALREAMIWLAVIVVSGGFAWLVVRASMKS